MIAWNTPAESAAGNAEQARAVECGICGYQDCICDAIADAEWDDQQEYGANRCPARE